MHDFNARIKDKDFTNDILFKTVLLKRKDLCKEIIQRCVPDIDIGEIEFVESEKEIGIGIDTKKIRIDAYTSDQQREYAIEMMAYRIEEIEKYARYHQSMLDAQLEMGSLPYELKDTIVIILCTFDPLGIGLPMYTIESQIRETKSPFKDGRRIVIVTSKGEEKASEEIKPIVKILAKKPGEDAFTKEVQKEVEGAKIKTEVRRAFMDKEYREYLIAKEAAEKAAKKATKTATKIGYEKGKENATKEIIESLMENLNISKEKAYELIQKKEQ